MEKLGEHNIVKVEKDAWSSGQISSKLWLCKELENLNIQNPQIIWVYGGWVGLASLLLLSREIFPVKHIRSFDKDPSYEHIADTILENWVWQSWKFKAITADCNKMDFTGEKPDIIINCSTEHFDENTWYQSIPTGTLVALQNNDMPHSQHSSCFKNCEEFAEYYDLNTLYQGTLDFTYPDWKFSRYMIIGTKK